MENNYINITDTGFEITGVKNVIDFDEKKILLERENDTLIIKGDQLCITKFDAETMVLKATGKVCELYFKGSRKPFLKKLFQ